MKFTILVLLAVASTAAAGCSDTKACSFDSDCFEGEVCANGTCEIPSADGNDAGTGETDLGLSDTSAPDMDAQPDVGVADDMTAQPDMVGDMAVDDAGGLGECRADPFDSCPSDEDDRFAEQITNVGFGRGCIRPDDDFDGGTVTLQGRTLCPREEADRYSIGVNPCASTSFIVDVTVTPTEQCPVDDWELEARIGAMNCTSPDAQCTTDGVSKTASFIIRPESSVLSLNIDVLPVAENVRFDYELDITYRE